MVKNSTDMYNSVHLDHYNNRLVGEAEIGFQKFQSIVQYKAASRSKQYKQENSIPFTFQGQY
jgi:hypothetical protein